MLIGIFNYKYAINYREDTVMYRYMIYVGELLCFVYMNTLSVAIQTHTHTHTHTYIYIYIYKYVCVCLCKYFLSYNCYMNIYYEANLTLT